MSTPVLSPWRAVGLVARREIEVQVVKKSFLISNAIIVLAIVGGIVGFAVFSGGGGDDRARVGLVGATSALGEPLAALGNQTGVGVEPVPVADEASARAAVAEGDLELALLPAPGGGAVAVVESEPPLSLRAVIEATLTTEAQRSAMIAGGVDPDQLAASAVLTVEAQDPPDPESGQRTLLAFVAVFVLYGQLIGFGLAVAMGVVEEKSSRVVELLLSTIRPLNLLWGKILGIGLLGLGQLVVYGVAALGAGLATGALTITGTALGVFASVLGWFVLGFAFFAVLYAAGGSMVSRQEDVNSTTGPLLLLILVMFGAAFYSVGDPEGTVSTALAWIPPFSAILMPLRVASDVATLGQIVGSALIMIVATVALASVAAKVYERSILRTGAQVSWAEAFGRSSSSSSSSPSSGDGARRPDGTAAPEPSDPPR